MPSTSIFCLWTHFTASDKELYQYGGVYSDVIVFAAWALQCISHLALAEDKRVQKNALFILQSHES